MSEPSAEDWIRATAAMVGIDPDEAAHAHLLAVEKNKCTCKEDES